MSWEQPVYSFNNGQPPTPTQTPTSATFDEHTFQTPKAESSFYDPRVTWNTADPYATSPNLLKTPRPLQLATPTLNQPSTPSSQKILLSGQDLGAEVASHDHYSSPTSKLSLPALEPANQPTSSPHISSGRERDSEQEEAFSSPTVGLALDINTSMQSASTMQTPPPTSTSASRRKGKQTKVTKLVQQSAATGRRMSAPLFPKPVSVELTSTQIESSAQQFSAFDFSPDVFEFPMPGPPTAPAYPQQKLFWEPKNEGMDLDFPEDFNIPFDTPRQPALDPFVSAHHPLSTSQVQNTSTFLDFHEDASKASLMAMDGSGFRETGFPTTGTVRHNPLPSKAINNVVDPSLLFSSPGKAAEPKDSSKALTIVPDDESILQPYAYQIQEAKREKAAGGIVKSKRRRKPDSDSPAVKAALETLRAGKVEDPDIRSSMTESIILRTNKAARHVSRISHSHSRKVSSAQGRSSPVKQNRTIRRPPHRRTSLALTIDSNGRAKTETRTIIDTGSPAGKDCMDFENRSDQSDSGDESYEALITSQAPSFAFPMEESKISKVGRFGPNIVSHSSHSSYASVHTAASSAESWYSAAYNRSQPPNFALEPVKHGGAAAEQEHYVSSVSSQSSERSNVADSLSEADTIMESDDDSGSAQYELMKVLKDRKETKRSKSTSRGQPKHHLHSPLTNQSSSRFLNGISPTTMSDPGLYPLSGGSSSHEAGNIRCVCHMKSSKGQLIICESCKNSLHIGCITSDPQRLPQVYLCVFCTGQTPNVKGGRVRDPARVGYAAPNSPLAQKTNRFR